MWESKTRTPYSERIIKYVDLMLKLLEIVFFANGAAVEGDMNGHRWKLVVEGKSVSWGGARTKDKGSKCEITKHVFLHSYLLKLCQKKNNITEFFPDTIVFYYQKTRIAR